MAAMASLVVMPKNLAMATLLLGFFSDAEVPFLLADVSRGTSGGWPQCSTWNILLHPPLDVDGHSEADVAVANPVVDALDLDAVSPRSRLDGFEDGSGEPPRVVLGVLVLGESDVNFHGLLLLPRVGGVGGTLPRIPHVWGSRRAGGAR